ncbi:hypothetical protein D9M71_408040 [compost metagenome]
MLETLDSSAWVALFLQRGDIGAQALQLCIEFFSVRRGTFQGGQFSTQGFDLGLQLRIGRLMFGVLGIQLRQALVQFGGLRGHLCQSLVQVRGLAGNTLLLGVLVLELAFQLADLQLQGLAVGVDTGLAGNNLSGNILQAPCRFLTDSREAFLGRHQLLFHQGDLLKAPPGQARERKEQRPDQRPQGTGTRRLDLHHRRRARMHDRAGGGRKVVIENVCTQARYIIEVVVGIVSHGH